MPVPFLQLEIISKCDLYTSTCNSTTIGVSRFQPHAHINESLRHHCFVHHLGAETSQ